MQIRSWLACCCLLAACGSKTPGPTDVPAAADDVAATSPAPADTEAPAPADTATTQAPPDDAMMVADTEAPPADTEAPPADTEAPQKDDTVAATVGLEDVTVAAEDTTALPADLPKVPGLAPEVVARLLGAQEGCVGIAKNGRALLSIASLEGEDKHGAHLMWTDLATADRGFAEQAAWPVTDPAALVASPELAAAVKGRNLIACQTATGSPIVIGKSVPVTVSGSERAITVGIDGNRPVVIDARVDIDVFAPVAAYWSEEVGTVFVRVERESRKDEPGATGVIAVAAADLGQSSCVPRPAGGKPVPSTPAPAFNPAPPEVSCVAMTADGTMAAFKTWSIDRMPKGTNGRPNAIEWFGTGTAPAIDLSCMARNVCKPEQKKALAEEAATLGLVGCAIAKSGIVLDGQVATAMYQGNEYKLKGGSGWRPVYTFMSGLDGEGHESLWKVFQHPAGGPVFLYVGNSDTDVEEVLVKVLDESAMDLCAKAPAGTLAIADVKASSAAGDGGGYKFGAMQLADNDLTTSWQPAASKAPTAPWVEVTLAAESEVTAVEIANGFQRRDGSGDMFVLNARAAAATLTFSDGSSEKVTFTPDARGLVRFDVTPRRTTSVRVTIDGLHDGSRWPKDVALSELRVMGPSKP